MPYSPITRTVYTDPNEVYAEHVKCEYLWEVFLYQKISKAEKPLYKILCADKEKIYQKEAELKETFGVIPASDPICRNTDCTNMDEPIVIDMTTGEFIIY